MAEIEMACRVADAACLSAFGLAPPARADPARHCALTNLAVCVSWRPPPAVPDEILGDTGVGHSPVERPAPMTDCLVRNDGPPLQQHFLNQAQPQWEPIDSQTAGSMIFEAERCFL